jgi:hypothetical protein
MDLRNINKLLQGGLANLSESVDMGTDRHSQVQSKFTLQEAAIQKVHACTFPLSYSKNIASKLLLSPASGGGSKSTLVAESGLTTVTTLLQRKQNRGRFSLQELEG